MSFFDDSTLAFLPSGAAGKDAKAYSIKPTNGTGDFTFERGSNLAATRVNKDGLIEKGRENLYTQSNNFSHSDWTPKAGTFASGVADPNGGTDAWSWTATNTDPFLYQSKSFSGPHALSIYVKGVGGTIGDDFQIRVGNNLKDITLTGDWQRVQHFGVLSGTVNIGFEYGNPATTNDVVHIYAAQLEVGTIATDYIDSGATTAKAGLLEDEPRFDYSGGATCPSLLIEKSRTNSITHSEYFGAWGAFRATITDNATSSPEGIINAAVLTEDTTNNSHPLNKAFSVSSGVEYTLSIFAKQGSRRYLALLALNGGSTIYYDLENKTAGSGGSVEDYGNGWLRLIYTYTTNSTSADLYIQPSINGSSVVYTGDGSNAVFLYGAQLEASAIASSYIPAHGASVTRGADNSYTGTTSGIIGQTQGVVFCEFIYRAFAEDMRLGISDGTSANFNNIRITSAGTLFVLGAASSVLQYEINGGALTDGQTYKVALKYNTNDIEVFVNGVSKGTDTSATIGACNRFGFDNRSAGANPFYSDVKKAILFNTALSDADCITLTTL